MLVPNWEDHDAEKNPIVNYFADRQHTGLLLKKIEKKIIKSCFYCKTVKTVQSYLRTIKFSNSRDFGRLTDI